MEHWASRCRGYCYKKTTAVHKEFEVILMMEGMQEWAEFCAT
jgi:hypothetical protein